jgi:hypothetical protein
VAYLRHNKYTGGQVPGPVADRGDSVQYRSEEWVVTGWDANLRTVWIGRDASITWVRADDVGMEWGD